MKNFVVIAFLFVAAAAFGQTTPAAPAQPSQPPTITMILERSLGYPESEFVPAAEAMPEDKYNFAPSPSNGEFKGVRTFGQQVRHVAAAQYMIAAAILSEKPPVELGGENGPETLKTKAEIVQFLKDSFVYMHKAYTSINESNATGQVQNPFGKNKVSRLSLAVLNVGHDFDHYGQMVEYLRMNGIIPPASRGQ
ncbi:MAG: DinB family protein [Terriglobales bacterium]